MLINDFVMIHSFIIAPRLTIDTLQELARGPISCGVWGEQNRQFFLTSTDEISHKLGEKIEIISTSEEAVSLFTNYFYRHFPDLRRIFFFVQF